MGKLVWIEGKLNGNKNIGNFWKLEHVDTYVGSTQVRLSSKMFSFQKSFGLK